MAKFDVTRQFIERDRRRARGWLCRRDRRLGQRVPGRAIGTLPRPLETVRTALGAKVSNLGLSHRLAPHRNSQK